MNEWGSLAGAMIDAEGAADGRRRQHRARRGADHRWRHHAGGGAVVGWLHHRQEHLRRRRRGLVPAMVHGISPEVVAKQSRRRHLAGQGLHARARRGRRHRQRQWRRPRLPDAALYGSAAHGARRPSWPTSCRARKMRPRQLADVEGGLRQPPPRKAASSKLSSRKGRRGQPGGLRRHNCASTNRGARTCRTRHSSPSSCPSLVAMLLFIALPIVSVVVQSLLRRARTRAGRGRELPALRRLHQGNARRHRGDREAREEAAARPASTGLAPTSTARTSPSPKSARSSPTMPASATSSRASTTCRSTRRWPSRWPTPSSSRRWRCCSASASRSRVNAIPQTAQGSGDLLLAAADDHHAAGRLADPLLDDQSRRASSAPRCRTSSTIRHCR